MTMIATSAPRYGASKMKLTEQQIRETVDRLRMPDLAKRAMLKQALAGRPETLFVLHTHYQRHLHGTTAADAVAAWAESVGVK